MYFDFKTNLEDSGGEKFWPPTMEIIFSNDVGYISIGCSFESDLQVCGGAFDARYKGLECQTFDRNYNPITEEWTECDDESMIDRFYSLMAGAEPVGFYINPEDLDDYPEDFRVRVRDFDAEVLFQFHGKELTWKFHADKLLEDADVMRRAYDDRDFLFPQKYLRAYYFPSGMKGETKATYLNVSRRDGDAEGWDYTFFDADFREIDGGVLENGEATIDEALPEILAMCDERLNLKETFRMDFDWLCGMVEDAEA
jgi:hypothetical protein